MWNNSVIPHGIREDFDKLIEKVIAEMSYIESLDEFEDINLKKRYDCLAEIYKVYNECRYTELSDI